MISNDMLPKPTSSNHIWFPTKVAENVERAWETNKSYYCSLKVDKYVLGSDHKSRLPVYELSHSKLVWKRPEPAKWIFQEGWRNKQNPTVPSGYPLKGAQWRSFKSSLTNLLVLRIPNGNNCDCCSPRTFKRRESCECAKLARNDWLPTMFQKILQHLRELMLDPKPWLPNRLLLQHPCILECSQMIRILDSFITSEHCKRVQ